MAWRGPDDADRGHFSISIHSKTGGGPPQVRRPQAEEAPSSRPADKAAERNAALAYEREERRRVKWTPDLGPGIAEIKV